MSQQIRFDISQFPLLTPKAFALAENKAHEEKKATYLVGKGTPPGIYGRGVRLEYDYEKPLYETQFKLLTTQYQTLGYAIEGQANQSQAIMYPYFNWLLKKIINNHFNIASDERQATYKLFKQQLEDILFGMHEAYEQAKEAKDTNLLEITKHRIRGTLTRLNTAFHECSEGTTEAMMEQQLNWVPADITSCLLRYRVTIMEGVAGQAAREFKITEAYESHAGTLARTTAHLQGYGIPSTQHIDQYGGDAGMQRFKAEVKQRLQTAFVMQFTYEQICMQVQQLFEQPCLAALQRYGEKTSLNPDEQDAFIEKIKFLVDSRVCQEHDLLDTIDQSVAMRITRVNPNLSAKLPEYCARYALFILMQQGYVKDIGQLRWQAAGQSVKQSACSLDQRIQSYSTAPAGTGLDQWCANRQGETILTEVYKKGEFFTLVGLLGKKKPEGTFLFNPFLRNTRGKNLFDLVFSNSQQQEVKKLSPQVSKPPLQQWQQRTLLQQILQHPAATVEGLTTGIHGTESLRSHHYVIIYGSYEIFTLYWDRIITLHQLQGHQALANFVNKTNRHGQGAIDYAVQSGDIAKVQKLVALPGGVCDHLIFTEPLTDDPQKKKIANLISCVNAIEKKEFMQARNFLATFAEKQETQYKQCLQLLKDRYGNPEYPHHADYQGFLQYLIVHETELCYLLQLKENFPMLDLSQPRLLHLKTGEEVKDTPLRVAIKDDDEDTITRLFEDAKIDPNIEVEQENPWILIASKRQAFSKKRQAELLDLLSDQLQKSLQLPTHLLVLSQLAAAAYTDAAFCHILENIKQNNQRTYYTALGEEELSRIEFVKAKEQKVAHRGQHIRSLGITESKSDPETTRLATAKQLCQLLNDIQDEKGYSVFHRVALTYQPKKVMRLLRETINLDMRSVFALPDMLILPGSTSLVDEPPIAPQPSDEKSVVEFAPSAKKRSFVRHLMTLIHILNSDTPNYAAANKCFINLRAIKKHQKYYQDLLIIVVNQCPKDHALTFLSQLAAVEQNIACLQLLQHYVPIDVITTLHYAARPEVSSIQFIQIWREAVDSLADLSTADTALKLEPLVKCLLEGHGSAPLQQQQLEKILIVLVELPIIAYLEKYYRPTCAVLNFLHALAQGQIDTAITYYLIDHQQSLEQSTDVAAPVANIITRQFGAVFFNKFLKQLRAQREIGTATGLVEIQHLMKSEGMAAARFLQHTEAGLLPTNKLIANLDLLLQLHFIGKGKAPWIFDEKIIAFFQNLLVHFPTDLGVGDLTDSSLQTSIILFLMPLDINATAQVFCNVFLMIGDKLLPEKIMLERLMALQGIMASPSHTSPSFHEFFSYIVGQLTLHKDFRGYDKLLTHFFDEMGSDQPFCQRRFDTTTITLPTLNVALLTQHYTFAEHVLDRAEAGKPLAVDVADNTDKIPLIHMVEIKEAEPRKKLMARLLGGEHKPVTVKEGKDSDRVFAVAALESGSGPGPGPEIVLERKQKVSEDKAPEAKDRPQLAVSREVGIGFVNASGNTAFMHALHRSEAESALMILDYALHVFRDNPSQLKQWAEQKNKSGETALLLATRQYPDIALRLLESVAQLDLALTGAGVATAAPDSKQIAGDFNIKSIIDFLLYIKSRGRLEATCWIESFTNCMVATAASEEVNPEQITDQITRQIIRLIRIFEQQCTPEQYEALFRVLLDQYSASPIIVTTLFKSMQRIKAGILLDILNDAVDNGNVNLTLARAILEYSLESPSGKGQHTSSYNMLTFIKVLENCGKYHKHVRGFIFTEIHYPLLPINTQYALIDLFLSNNLYQTAGRLWIKDNAAKPACYFPVFLKLFSYDSDNELLSLAEDKSYAETLSPQKKIFLLFFQALIKNPSGDTELFQQFHHLLSLVQTEANALPQLFQVLQKKLPAGKATIFLKNFLLFQRSMMGIGTYQVTEDPMEYLSSAHTQLQNKVESECAVVDEKGDKQRIRIKKDSDDLIKNYCNFPTLLAMTTDYSALQAREEKLGKEAFAASELATQKRCFLLLTIGSTEEYMVPSLEYLAFSLPTSQFQQVLDIMKDELSFRDVLTALLTSRIRVDRLYQGNKANLQLIIDTVVTCRFFAGREDSPLHLLIREGHWDMARQPIFAKYANTEGKDEQIPLKLALRSRFGDAKQRQACVAALVSHTTLTVPRRTWEDSLLMEAILYNGDIACFRILLDACSAAVINHTPFLRDPVLKRAINANQPDKVRALLEAKRKPEEKERGPYAAVVAPPTVPIPVIGIKERVVALAIAHQKVRQLIVDVFWSCDTEHQLKRLFTTSSPADSSLDSPVFYALASQAYYLLYKDATELANIDVPSTYRAKFYADVIQQYGDYKQLFADEKTCDKQLALLERGNQINHPLFAGLSPLDYALQTGSPTWLLPKLLALPSVTVNTEQVRLIYRNPALREYLTVAFTKFFVANTPINIAALLAQFYIDGDDAVSTVLRELLTPRRSSQRLKARNLCSFLLKNISRQLAVRRDAEFFIYLFTQSGNSSYNKIDATTGDTAMTFAVRQGWLALAQQLASIDSMLASTNSEGQSPLDLALFRADKVMSHAILDAKCQGGLALWPITPETDSALILAVKLGDLPLCQKIVARAQSECKEELADFLNHKNALDKSALYLAAEQQQEDIVRWLLSLPGIDTRAYCATTHRSAALCSYQQVHSQPAQSPQTAGADDAKIAVKAADTLPDSLLASVAEPTPDALPVVVAEEPAVQELRPPVEVEATAMPSTLELQVLDVKAAEKASPVANRILQLFIEQALINPSTVAIDDQLADIAQHLGQGQQDRAIQALLILLQRHDYDQLDTWLERLPLRQNGRGDGSYETFVAQLSLSALRLAASTPERLPLVRSLLAEAKLIIPTAQRNAGLNQCLQATTILFSQATLDAVLTDDALKFLWPAAALAYARACNSKPQHLASQQALIQKIFAVILDFSTEEIGSNAILPAVMKELNEALQKFFAPQKQSVVSLPLYENLTKSCNALLRQLVIHDQVNVDKVHWLLSHSEIKMPAATEQPRLFLVDVNIPTDAKMARSQPLVFTLLERAEQENVDEKDERKKPCSTVLKMLVFHRTWQDTSKDNNGQTLLIRAITADPSIFESILMKTRVSTWMVQVAGRNAMDFALPNPMPATCTTDELKNRWTKREDNKFANGEILAKNLQGEFKRCIQRIKKLQADPDAFVEDDHGDPVDLVTLREQARNFARELLKFDVLRVERLPRHAMVFQSFWSVISKQVALQDLQHCQSALQSGLSISTNTELLDRAAKLPQFFIQQLVGVWHDIVPPPAPTSKVVVEAQPLSDSHQPALLNFSRPLW